MPSHGRSKYQRPSWFSQRRPLLGMAAGGLGLSLALSTFMLLPASPATAGSGTKVTICHRTSSVNNPYVAIDIDTNSIDEPGNQYLNGHGDHTGPVFDPNSPQDGWGDIIPPFTDESSGNSFPGYNWGAGQAIWNNGCTAVTPTPTETSPTPTPTETTPTPTPTETTPTPTPTETGHRVPICHRTSSVSNPYVSEGVDSSSIDEEGNQYLNGHGDHTGPVFNADSPPAEWGDIIPPFTDEKSGNSFPGYNWLAGQAIWANDCNVTTPTPTPTETTPTPTPTPTETTPTPTPTETTPTPTPTQTTPTPTNTTVIPPTPTETTPTPTPTETTPTPTPTETTGTPTPTDTSPTSTINPPTPSQSTTLPPPTDNSSTATQVNPPTSSGGGNGRGPNGVNAGGGPNGVNAGGGAMAELPGKPSWLWLLAGLALAFGLTTLMRAIRLER